MIASGMWVQAIGIGLFVMGRSLFPWLSGSVLLGIGTALVYPTLLAAVSDVAHPEWRDGGYALGALLSGILADTLGIPSAMLTIAILTFISGIIVASVMYDTLPTRRLNHYVTATAQPASISGKIRSG
jgi:MFS family permease